MGYMIDRKENVNAFSFLYVIILIGGVCNEYNR